MRFKCEHCSAQYMIADEKVGKKGVRVRCKKCGEIITVKPLADEDDADTSLSDQDPPAGRDETEVSQSPDESGEEETQPPSIQPGGEEGFDLGDDEELGNAFDSLLGDEEEDDLDDDDQVDYDRQSTRVFNMQEMAKVQEERDQAAQISDLYNSAQATEGTDAGQTSPGGEDRDKAEWYAAVDEQQVGPMSAAELEERYRQEEFDADTLVWKSGFDDWLAIVEIDVFRHLAVSQPEPPAPDVDEKTIAWGREQESEEDLGIDQALGAPQQSSFEDEAEPGMDQQEESDYGDDTEGLYDDEESSAVASAAAFAGADVDWKPSAIANLNTLAEEELASLKPPEETEESESEFPFGDEGTSDEVEEGAESDMEDGDSSIIGQIAAEEEAAARRAEEEKQAEEQRSVEVKKKQEEDDLVAQEAARREREEEQRDRAAPPPEQVLQRSGFPKWAIGMIAGVGGVIAILLGIIAYKLVAGPQEATNNEHTAQPITPPAKTAGVNPATTAPDKVPSVKEATPTKPATGPEAVPTETTSPEKDTKVAIAEAAKKVTPPESKSAPVKKPELRKETRKLSPKRPVTSKRRKKRKTEVKREKPEPVVREPPPIAEPPPPPPEKKKPRRRPSKGGLLDFDDEAAFAEVTGSKTATAARPAPKPVKKELPPLSNADVMAVMRNHVPEFKACNRKQQAIDRSVKGKMLVSFTISPSGSVSRATTKTARFKSTFVSGCITKVIKQIRFPKFGGKPKKVPFPFNVK